MGFGSEVQPYPPQVAGGRCCRFPKRLTVESWMVYTASVSCNEFIMAKLVLDVDETQEKNANSKEMRKE